MLATVTADGRIAYTLESDGRPLPAACVRTLVVAESRNSKLAHGGIRPAAVYRTQGSCPISCPFYSSGCYARGRIFGTASRLGAETGPDSDYRAVRALVDILPPGGVVRFNVSGDYLAADGRPDVAYIDATNSVAIARPDVTILAYSHAWRILEPGMFAYVVAASADTSEDAATAIRAGWAPVMVTPPADSPGSRIGATIAGRRVVECPASSRGRSCVECRLCARSARAIVGFVAHGSGSAQAIRAIAAAEDRRARIVTAEISSDRDEPAVDYASRED